MIRCLKFASFVLFSQAYLSAAQSQSGEDAAAAAGLLGCLGCGGFLVLIPVVGLIVQISLLVWVAKDAKARGLDNSLLWMIFVFAVPFIGFLVYFFSRPQGNMANCASCGNKRLEAAAKCPHCGN